MDWMTDLWLAAGGKLWAHVHPLWAKTPLGTTPGPDSRARLRGSQLSRAHIHGLRKRHGAVRPLQQQRHVWWGGGAVNCLLAAAGAGPGNTTCGLAATRGRAWQVRGLLQCYVVQLYL